MKELLFIASFCCSAALVLFMNSTTSEFRPTWAELHECDGKVYEVVVDRKPSRAFLEDFCQNLR